MAKPAVYGVIMAGGSGTRFWPLSRAARPKQFLALATARPMITETMARLSPLITPAHTFVVCGKRHAAAVRKTLPKLPRHHVLVEPEARNTAPAIALATAHVAREDLDAVLVVLPSDQHVANVKGFQTALTEAIHVARTGAIVTLGITPTRPETGYGYIRLGEPVSGTTRRVGAFVEKPDLARAQAYLASKDSLWNAGIFVFTARAMLEAFAAHAPQMTKPLQAIRDSLGTRRAPAVLAREFKRLPAISIDYAVAEKASNIMVVPCACGWSDVGSFNALSEVRSADASGNVVSAELGLVVDSTGCIVVGGSRPIAVVGMTDVVVIDAGDAILVLPKDKSQDVRKIVEALKQRNLKKYL